jgi:glycosyltransferase involved in cell wall biosynthesis
MRVLHVISALPRAAGTSVFCAELCEYLQAQGVECCIVVRKKKADDYVPGPAVSVIEMGGDFSGLPFVPDLVHIHALWDPFLRQFARWARRKRFPLVYSPHGMLTPWALSQKRFKKTLALAAYQYWDLRLAAILHATAVSELDDIRRLRLRQPVVVAPLGVKVSSESPTVRHTHPRIALFVSRVHPKKGLLNLVDAWARVNPHGWKMVIAGPDQDGHAAEVMARARAAGIDQDFEMMGPVYGKEKNDHYAKADLFVLPTYSENFGVVVVEALAQGCPVITTKGTPWQELQGRPASSKVLKCESAVVGEVGGRKSDVGGEATSAFSLQPSALTANGRCGWWIDIGVEPLADALREAMSLTDEERHQLGLNGRRLVEAKYTWPAIADQMKRTYEWVLQGGEKPECVRVG